MGGSRWKAPGPTPLRQSHLPGPELEPERASRCSTKNVYAYLTSEDIETNLVSSIRLAAELKVGKECGGDVRFPREQCKKLKDDQLYSLKCLALAMEHRHSHDPDHSQLDEAFEEMLTQRERDSAFERMVHQKMYEGKPWPSQFDPRLMADDPAEIVCEAKTRSEVLQSPCSEPASAPERSSSSAKNDANKKIASESKSSEDEPVQFSSSDDEDDEEDDDDWAFDDKMNIDVPDNPPNERGSSNEASRLRDPDTLQAPNELVGNDEAEKSFDSDWPEEFVVFPYRDESDYLRFPGEERAMLEMWLNGATLRDIHSMLISRGYMAHLSDEADSLYQLIWMFFKEVELHNVVCREPGRVARRMWPGVCE